MFVSFKLSRVVDYDRSRNALGFGGVIPKRFGLRNMSQTFLAVYALHLDYIRIRNFA